MHCLFVHGWPFRGYSGILFPAYTVTFHEQSTSGVYHGNHFQYTYAYYHLFYGYFNAEWCLVLTVVELVLASRSVARGWSVAWNPKVQDHDCVIWLHTITAHLHFIRCSPSHSSYFRCIFLHLFGTNNQRIHSNQYSWLRSPMIPPVQMIPVWGRARSSPVHQESRSGLDCRLAVLDWTGLVWTSLTKLLEINSN